jgi:preprotein translocase subunit YajC
MLTSLFLLFAEGQQEQPSMGQTFYQFLPFVAILVLAYLFFLRPMKRQEAERQALLAKVKKNDEILTSGGIYATVVEVSDKEDKIIVKISDNVRVKITKAAIARNITNEEEAAKAKEQPAKKEGAA